jgi:SAM-dependent methyltransferase
MPLSLKPFSPDTTPKSVKTELLQACLVCDSKMLEIVDPACNITQCRNCGYIFDNPRPTLEELVGFYSKPTKYDSWLCELGIRDRLWKRRLSKLRSTKKPGALLDVGAGIGQFLFLARDSYDAVYGTEVSSAAIQIAKQKYNLDLFQGTIEKLDMRGKVFDNVTLFHVLEHVPDPRLVLKRCNSLLSAEGILVIAVPNEVASLRGSLKRMFVRIGIRPRHGTGKLGLPRISLDGSIDEIHLSHFSPIVLHRLLQATGFSVIASTLDPYYVATGIRRLKADVYYHCCLALLHIFKVNLYDTILVIARKTSASQ